MYLFVVVRVEVYVVYDDVVGRCEVNPQTPCPGGEKEHETVLRGTAVKLIYHEQSLFYSCAAV